MAKTRPTDADVGTFLAGIEDAGRRADAQDVCRLMEQETGQSPVMWGESIVGFGARTVKYASGRELDWLVIGFSPRKANITLYLSTGETWNEELLAKLGKHKTGMGCLYFKRLSDVDEKVLEKLIIEAAEYNK